jgi:hypothetical protein
MKHFHTHIRDAGHEVSLTEGERLRIRYALSSYMQLRPIARRAQQARVPGIIPMIFWQRTLAFVALLAVLGSSAGISYAAESSLPGDLLYPVKISINEPVRGALATSPSAKAKWAIGVAAQRATEAATLAAEQRLDPETQSQLASSLVAHAHVAEAALDEQATSAPQVSAQEAARFEARLSEYERVIASIAEDDADAAPTMASAIREERARVASVRERAEESSDDGSEAIHAIIRGRLSATERVAKDNHGAFSSATADALVESIAAASATLPDLERDRGASSTRADLMRSLEQSERLATFVEASAAIHQRTGLVIDDSRHSGRSRGKNGKNKDAEARAAVSAPAAMMLSAPAADTATTTVATTTPDRIRTEDRPDDSRDSGGDEHEGDHERTLQISVPQL